MTWENIIETHKARFAEVMERFCLEIDLPEDNLFTDERIERLKNGRDVPLSKALMETLDGVSPIVCRELSDLATAGLDTTARELSNDECEKLVDAVENLAEKVKNGDGKPYAVIEENGHPLDFTFMEVKQYGDSMTVMYSQNSSIRFSDSSA